MNDHEVVASFFVEGVRQVNRGEGQIRVLSNVAPVRQLAMRAWVGAAAAIGMFSGLAQAAENGDVVHQARSGGKVIYQATTDTSRVLRGIERMESAGDRGTIQGIAAAAKLLGTVLNSKTFKSAEGAVGQVLAPEPEASPYQGPR